MFVGELLNRFEGFASFHLLEEIALGLGRFMRKELQRALCKSVCVGTVSFSNSLVKYDMSDIERENEKIRQFSDAFKFFDADGSGTIEY